MWPLFNSPPQNQFPDLFMGTAELLTLFRIWASLRSVFPEGNRKTRLKLLQSLTYFCLSLQTIHLLCFIFSWSRQVGTLLWCLEWFLLPKIFQQFFHFSWSQKPLSETDVKLYSDSSKSSKWSHHEVRGKCWELFSTLCFRLIMTFHSLKVEKFRCCKTRQCQIHWEKWRYK